MLDLKPTNVSSYASLSEQQQIAITCFIQGLVQGALAFSKRFCVSDLVGGKNTDWTNTPLDLIYKYHVNNGAKNPEAEAGKDVGRLVKNVLIADSKEYIVDGTIQKRFKSNLYSYK